MDYVKEFLDTSTIHGLSRISSTRRLLRLFWILIVIGGFSGAGYLIYKSFETWQQSPITTTIEALPTGLPLYSICIVKKGLVSKYLRRREVAWAIFIILLQSNLVKACCLLLFTDLLWLKHWILWLLKYFLMYRG